MTEPLQVPTLITPATATQVKELRRLSKDRISAVALVPDGRLLAVSTNSGIYLYNAQTFDELRFIGTDSPVRCLTFAPDGQTLAFGLDDTTVKLWRVRDGKALHTFTGHTAGVCSVAFAPDGETLASGSDDTDTTVKLWQVRDGTLLQTFTGHTGRVSSVAFISSELLVSGSRDGTVQVRSINNGVLMAESVRYSSISSVISMDVGIAFSSQANTVIILMMIPHTAPMEVDWGYRFVDLEYRLRFKGRQQFERRQWFIGHTDRVTCIACAPDGKILASASGDKTVKLWRVSDGTLLHTLEGHTASVESVAFTRDGQTLASSSLDGTVRLWGVKL